MNSNLNLLETNSLEIKVKDKQKNKNYSTNFLGQFMNKDIKQELKPLENQRN